MIALPSGHNMRDLGGTPTPEGSVLRRRVVRSGELGRLRSLELARLAANHVSLVVDLRSESEARGLPDRLPPGARRVAVPLYSRDLHDPSLGDAAEGDALGAYYLQMLANHEAVRDLFHAIAGARPGTAVLLHCAAGIDRTGIAAMLLLGLVGAPREQILADYARSYLPEGAAAVTDFSLAAPMALALTRLEEGFGGVPAYLCHAGVADRDLDAVARHLLG